MKTFVQRVLGVLSLLGICLGMFVFLIGWTLCFLGCLAVPHKTRVEILTKMLGHFIYYSTSSKV